MPFELSLVGSWRWLCSAPEYLDVDRDVGNHGWYYDNWLGSRWIYGNEASRSIPVEAVHCWCSLSGIEIVLKSFCRDCKNIFQNVGRWGSRLWRFAFKIVFCCKAHHHLQHDNGRLSNPHHWRLAIPSHTIMNIILLIIMIIMVIVIIVIILIIVVILIMFTQSFDIQHLAFKGTGPFLASDI